MNDKEFYGTLNEGEIHPAASIALDYVRESLRLPHGTFIQESLASTAISGDRLAEVCCETLRRLIANEPVSDRYLFGLAWVLWSMNEKKKRVDAGEIQ